MLREPKGARRYNEKITLTKSSVTVDEFGHKSIGARVPVIDVYASVSQLSAAKTMLTFQQADVVGLDIEFRAVPYAFDGIEWRGHVVSFAKPQDVGNRGMVVRVSGYYQQDNPNA